MALPLRYDFRGPLRGKTRTAMTALGSDWLYWCPCSFYRFDEQHPCDGSSPQRPWLEAQQEGDAANSDQEGFAQPAHGEIVFENNTGITSPKPQPKRLRKRFVKRGKAWLRAVKISCRIGESVYVRDAPGRFTKIGVVADDLSLPVVYLEEKS